MIENRLVADNRRSEHYHSFSEGEYERRQEEVREWMDDEGLDSLVIFGNGGLWEGNTTNIAYLTNYWGMFMTYLAFFPDPDEGMTLYSGLSNHLQYIREVSVVDDIRLMIPDPPQQLADRVKEAGQAEGTTGVVALDPRYKYSIPHEHQVTFEEELDGEIRDVTNSFVMDIHSVKSDEQIEWIRKGSQFCDLGMEALVDAAEPGVTEYELDAEMKYAYMKEGGEHAFSFINSAPMEGAEPGEAVTWKHASTREVEEGDIITTEFSASYHGHSGQLHRPVAVGREPTDEYLEMWELAVETYEGMLDALKPGNTAQDVADATAPIDESEYKIYDVMLHGFGNAYIHPFIGTPSSNYWPGGEDDLTADWEFKENQTVVIQPNILNQDETRCFQIGTTVAITDDGAEVLQDFPLEFIQV